MQQLYFHKQSLKEQMCVYTEGCCCIYDSEERYSFVELWDLNMNGAAVLHMKSKLWSLRFLHDQMCRWVSKTSAICAYNLTPFMLFE